MGLKKEKMNEGVLQQKPQPIPREPEYNLDQGNSPLLRVISIEGLTPRYLVPRVVLGSRLSYESLAVNILSAGGLSWSGGSQQHTTVSITLGHVKIRVPALHAEPLFSNNLKDFSSAWNTNFLLSAYILPQLLRFFLEILHPHTPKDFQRCLYININQFHLGLFVGFPEGFSATI